MEPTILARIRVSRPRTPRHRLPTRRRPHIHRLRVLLRLGINTHVNCSVQAVRNRLADKADLQDRVVAALLTHVEEGVCSVGSLDLLISVVGRGFLDLTQEVLLNVKLPDVRDCAACDGVVGEERGAVVDDGCTGLATAPTPIEEVGLTVEMVGTTNIVTWDDCDEGSSAV